MRSEASLMVTEAEVSVRASLTDLSLTGLAASHVPREIPGGRVVHLDLALGDLPRPLSVDGRVVWCQDHRAGFAFVDLSAEDRKMLEGFLEGRERKR
jgi:hypothetical protein